MFIGYRDPDDSPNRKRGHGGGRGKLPGGKPPTAKPSGRGRGQGPDPQPQPQTSNNIIEITEVLTYVVLFVPTIELVVDVSVVSEKKVKM